MPEGVDSFVMMSVSPAKVVEALSQVDPSGEMKAKIEELVEKLKTQSRIDFDKDLLGNLGPKLVVYLGPGRSAATSDEGGETDGTADRTRSDGTLVVGSVGGLAQADPGWRAARPGRFQQGA